MAAVLKKRAVAEFTQVIQEEEKQQPPLKKLRLVYRPKHAELQLDISKCSTAREAFQVLQVFEESLPLSAESVQPTIGILLEHFRKEAESCVRAKIANLLIKLCGAPGFNGVSIVDDIKNLLRNEKSDVVRSQLIAVLTAIGQSQCGNSRLLKLLVDCAVKHLNDASHLVRCKSLKLVGLLGSPDHLIKDNRNSLISVLSTLESFTHEPDCRVRTHAFESMLMWHQRGLKLSQSVYGQACLALTDDYEGVRLTSVKLIWVLSQLYPNETINLSASSEPIRMVDDGFANLCNMVNDISMAVRAESARLLGSLHAVSPRFLEQTLDKKLMSNMRLKRSAHERQREHFESGEWSSGQRWADDAPKEDLDPDSISLISNGACGAFVHGLEDEFLEVRNATIDSLCELASNSPSFAKLSQDFLVDMFNDEIESVRLNAINSLRKICHHFLLREDQLEIILSVLKDFNFEIRESVRDMLSCCRLSTKVCLNVIVTTLLDNMNRYLEDRQSIWKCMMNIGKHHSALVLAMAPELLSTHPFFESIEPDINDPAYISVLVLIFNAAVDCPTMMPLFPDYLTRHYTYLRDILPELVPWLKFAGLATQDSRPVSQLSSGKTTLLSQILKRLESIEFMDNVLALQLIKIAIRDLKQVDHLEPELSASAQCTVLHLKAQLFLNKAVMKSGGLCSVLRSQHDQSLVTMLVQNVLELTAQMEHVFLGLGLADIVQIRQLSLMALALQLLCQLQECTVTDKKVALCEKFVRYLSRLQLLVSRCGSTTNAFTEFLLSELPNLKLCEPEKFPQILMSSFNYNKPFLLRLSNDLCRTSVDLVEPSSTSDVTVKFIAGLAAPVNLVAYVNNVTHLERLRIQVKYPDQQTHLVLPPLSDFRQLSSLRHKLVTKVLLSHALWSEQCPVKLCIVMESPANEDEEEEDVAVSERKTPLPDAAEAAHVVELCCPVSVNVLPMAGKKS